MNKYTVIIIGIIAIMYISTTHSETIDETQSDDQQIQNGKNSGTTELDEIWKEDSKKIFQLISHLRQYRTNYKDSSIQADHRKRQMIKELSKANKSFKGTTLSLKSVRVNDVDQEKVLTEYGISYAIKVINKLRKDPGSKGLFGDDDIRDNPFLQLIVGFQLVKCKKCFRNTGRYNVKCEIPIPSSSADNYNNSNYKQFEDGIFTGIIENDNRDKTIKTEIIFVINSKEEALKISKDSIMPISGKIKQIFYKGSRFSEDLTIKLE